MVHDLEELEVGSKTICVLCGDVMHPSGMYASIDKLVILLDIHELMHVTAGVVRRSRAGPLDCTGFFIDIKTNTSRIAQDGNYQIVQYVMMIDESECSPSGNDEGQAGYE